MNTIKINETPIRTSRNFKINNITINAPEIPEKINEFQNVQITTQSTNCEKTVENLPFTYGIGEEQEAEITKLTNNKISIKTDKKENINIEEALKIYADYLGINMSNYSKSELGYGSLTSEDSMLLLTIQSNLENDKLSSLIEISLLPN